MFCYHFWICYTASHNFLQTTGAVSTLVILSSFMDTGGGGVLAIGSSGRLYINTKLANF